MEQRCTTTQETLLLELEALRAENERLRAERDPLRGAEGLDPDEGPAAQADLNRRILDSTDAHLAVIGPDGLILGANEAWLRFAEENGGGAGRAWGVGASYFVESAEEWGEMARAAEAFRGIRHVQCGRMPHFTLEYPCRGPDGRERWYLMHALPLQGTPGAVLISRSDVTARRQAEQALCESETRLGSIFRSSAIAVGVSHLASEKFVEVSDGFTLLFGYSREELVGHTALEAGFAAFPEEHSALLAQLEASGRIGEFELHARCKSGDVRVLALSAEVVQLGGEPHYIVVALDITDRKRAEEETALLLVRSRRDDEAKGRLLQEINHRVKNNLVSLLGLLLAERRGTPPESLPTVGATLERVSERIRGMLAAHEMLSEAEWAPLLLADLAERVVRQVLSHSIVVGHSLLEVVPSYVRVSPRQVSSLALVLNELATNTLKYAAVRDDTPIRVTVTIGEDQEFVTLRYRDDGPGYPETVLQGELPSVGLGLVSSLVAGTLRGSLSLSNDEGAVATVRVLKEDPANT